MKRRQWTLGLLTAGVIAAGCGPGFDPYNRLNSLRVLAIRSEPVAPAPGEMTTITANVYTPDGTPARYAWSWCPFATTPGAPCAISEGDLAALTGVAIPYDLGTGTMATFTHAIPADRLEAACAAQPGVPAPDCTDGFPIQLKLTVRTDSDEVQAVRPLRLRFRAQDQANANPALDHLYAVMDRPEQRLDADPLPVIPRHKETVIGAVLKDGVDNGAQSYMGKDDSGNPAQLLERLYLSWFVQNGDTDVQRTSFIDGTDATLDRLTKIKWTSAFKKDFAAATSKVIVIIRDNREGVDWIEGAVGLEETP